MVEVIVLFDAVTGQYRTTYHTRTCWHLEHTVVSTVPISLAEAEGRRLSPCLHCHRTRNRDWQCPTCTTYLLPVADPIRPDRVQLVCKDGHITLRQKPRKG